MMMFLSMVMHGVAHPQAPEPAIVQDWLDAVVLLTNNGAFCSGALIDTEGTVLTAYHCIASGRHTHVEFRNGQTFEATTIAVDVNHDLALISLGDWSESDGKRHPVLRIHPTLPQQGETVYALGHPLAPYERKPLLAGTLQWSMSQGIVSAVGERLIQVDAPLNPGNSGGPILNTDGKIVGVASRKLRGDNLSFLGPATFVEPMQSNPQQQPWWGGQLSLGLGYQIPLGADGLPIVMGQVQLIARDRWVLGIHSILQPNISTTNLDQWVPANALKLSRRARFGVGELTSSLDFGVGLTHQWFVGSGIHAPLPTAHITTGLGNLGLRYEAGWDLTLPELSPMPNIWMMAVEIHLPGVIQVF